MKASFNITLGVFCWHALRDLVAQSRLRGHKVELIEGRGWLDREFRVEGDEIVVRAIYAALRNWDRETSGKPA